MSNIWGESAVQLAFPGFKAPDWTSEKIEKIKGRLSPAVKNVLLQPAQHRRYGGYTLKRGCYHSVCLSDRGDDFGTLASELKAYRDRTDQDIVVDVIDGNRFPDDYFRDPRLPEAFDQIKEQSLFIGIYPASRLRKLIEPLGDAALALMSSPTIMLALTDDRRVWIMILPEICYHEIPDVVDLRDPETRQSFYEVFRMGGDVNDLPSKLSKTAPIYSRPLGGNISSFLEMIPELISPYIGGADEGQGGITQTIGTYLHARSVSGLVYPSARNDCYVEIRNGSTSSFGGWNYVDFRHAPLGPLDAAATMDVSPWDIRVFDDVRVQAPTEGQFAGSLKIEGLSISNDSRYYNSATDRRHLLDRLNSGVDSILLWGSVNLDAILASNHS